MLYVNPSYLNVSCTFKLLWHLLSYLSTGEKSFTAWGAGLCINNNIHTAKPENIVGLCLVWCSHPKDVESHFLVVSRRTRNICKYFLKWLKGEGRSHFSCHTWGSREQQMWAAKRDTSSLNQGYKTDFFSISIYLELVISIYTLPFHIHSTYSQV